MEVFLASGNRHKFLEFVEMANKARLKVNLHTADALDGMPEVDESSDTFAGNAQIKAEALAEKAPAGSWILADDSGLAVDYLNGAPGVLSARYAGLDGNSLANNLKLLTQMRCVPDDQRTARFHCVLYLLQVGGSSHLFEGTCEGHILREPVGHAGFGYDPVFQPMGYAKSFAEMGAALKNKLSHRAQAVRKWIRFMETLEP